MQCARHPKVETALSCTRCSTPICPDCSVSGAVGMLCPSCASNKDNPLYKVRPERFLLAVLLGLAAGVVVGMMLQMVSGLWFIYLLVFIGPIIGGAVGEVILRATGRKRGQKLEILAGVSVIGGAIISLLLSQHWVRLMHDPVSLVLYVVAVVLTAVAAINKIRNL
jgi:hypothetical protein